MTIERRIKRIRTLIDRPMFFNSEEAEIFLKEDIPILTKEIKILQKQIELMAIDIKSPGQPICKKIEKYRKKAIQCLK